MFTGIIEAIGKIEAIGRDAGNMRFAISCPFLDALRIDQSIAHNGVCLTVVEITESAYVVVAVDETLNRSNLGQLTHGDFVNLERCLKVGDRLDGHYVQGHVDAVGRCVEIADRDGSWILTFSFPNKYAPHLVDKGSISVNGISLTVIEPDESQFSVAIIPYTYEYTNLHLIKIGDAVNLEFDILGKYLLRAAKFGVSPF